MSIYTHLIWDTRHTRLHSMLYSIIHLWDAHIALDFCFVVCMVISLCPNKKRNKGACCDFLLCATTWRTHTPQNIHTTLHNKIQLRERRRISRECGQKKTRTYVRIYAHTRECGVAKVRFCCCCIKQNSKKSTF